MKLSRSAIGFISINILVLAGCPVTGDDLCAKGTCEAAVDATSPDAADAGPDGLVVEPRDPCIDKPTATECVTSESAIFVSKSADPNGADGTIGKPYPSIATALGKVTAQKKRVYVCEGTYEEQISIESVASTLIGGLACDFRTAGAKPRIKPSSGIAVGVAKVGGASVIDVIIEAASDVNAPGSSAVGVFVTESVDILFRGVEITAAAGQPGTDGKDGNDTPNHNNQRAPLGVPGNPDGSAGIAVACSACADGTSSKAGNGAARVPFSEATVGDAMPPVSGQLGNEGLSGSIECTNGKPGKVGDAAAKATGGTVPGKLAAKSWTDRSTTATSGKNGGPGQGGGGGGVIKMSTSGGGGSGACGGCGGTAGTAGTDGGSSIGVLVYRSPRLVFEKSKITAAAGGKGGKGGAGQAGQEAPAAGALGGGNEACNGGAGGHGGGGGGGGGGVGGYSAAIAYVEDSPTTLESTLAHGAPGDPGTGGLGGPAGGTGGKAGEDGAPGAVSKAGDVLPLE